MKAVKINFRDIWTSADSFTQKSNMASMHTHATLQMHSYICENEQTIALAYLPKNKAITAAKIFNIYLQNSS